MNMNGDKACRKVNKQECQQIAELIPGYNNENSYFPSGICKTCIFLLKRAQEGNEVEFILPEEYHVTLPRNLRSRGQKCDCKICDLARLNGNDFQQWQREMKGKVKPEITRLCTSCFRGLVKGQKHSCSAHTLEAVQNLTMTLPEEVRAKLAYDYLSTKVDAAGDKPIFLTPPSGGHSVPVFYGKSAETSPIEPLTHEEAITIGSQNGLSSQTMENIMADLRAKYGRNFVEPGLSEATISHNSQYAEFFTAEEVNLLDSKQNEQEKLFFYCSSLIPFIQKVCENRGIKLEEQKMKVGVDHGLEWEKITLSLSPNLPTFSPSTTFTDPNPNAGTAQSPRKKKTRTYGSESATGLPNKWINWINGIN